MKARSPETRFARAALFSVAVLFGAVSCTDNPITEPLVRENPLAGMAESYDSATPPELKAFNQPPEGLAAVAPLFSTSAASVASASAVSAAKIPFAPVQGPFANVLPGCDDCFYGPFDIGFNFNYFGNTYSKFYVSTNGFIAFTPIGPDPVDPRRKAGCCEGRSIPLADHVNDAIAIVWGDLDTRGVTRALSFETRGAAPNRRLIVNFAGAKDLNEGGKPVTAQLVLYQGTNNVEIHTANSSARLRRHTQGVENHLGAEASFVPGRVAALYSLANDAVRFSGSNNAPVALPGGNAGSAPDTYYEGVEGVAVEFKGSGVDPDNDALSYSWDFDNDGVADAQRAEASFTFADNGTHSALLTVSDGRGGVAQARVNVVIRNAAPVVDAGSDAQVHAGETVGFSGRFSDKGAKDAPWGWTWNLGSLGNYSGTTGDQSAAVLSSQRFCKAGSFPVKLTVVDKDGGSGSDELVVTVDALPVQIDVNPNTINLGGGGHGMITVQIYSRDGLDATALNPDAIRLTNGSGHGTRLARSGSQLHWDASEDLNGDGRLDVSAGFRRDELIANGDLTPNTAELSLSGEVGTCGDVLGKAPVRVMVPGKPPAPVAR